MAELARRGASVDHVQGLRAALALCTGVKGAKDRGFPAPLVRPQLIQVRT